MRSRHSCATRCRSFKTSRRPSPGSQSRSARPHSRSSTSFRTRMDGKRISAGRAQPPCSRKRTRCFPSAARPTSEPVPVSGLFEAHLTVSDLSRSTTFYRDVVGLPIALELPDRGAAFFWIGAPGEAMLGLWSLGSAPMGLSLHVAFETSLEDVLGACERLRALDVTPLSFFGEETGEPSVIGWMPAASVYFRDPDGHLLEYLAMLD